jgi:hypothetical protein
MTDTSAILEPASAPVPTDHVSSVTARRLRTLATALAVVGVGLAIAMVRFGTAGDPRFQVGFDLGSVAPVATSVLYPLIGALIIQRRPRTRVAWIMIAIGLGLGFGFAGYGYGAIGMPPRTPLPGALAAIILSQFLFVPVLATGITAFFLLFPTDRMLGPRWPAVMWLSIGSMVCFLVANTVRPGMFDAANFPELENPFGLPPAWGPTIDGVILLTNIGMLSSAALAVVSLVQRYRQGGAVERAQIRWIALGAAFVAGSFAVAAFQIEPISDRAWELGFAFLSLLPIGIFFAITRYRLYEIDRLINRTLVYGALTAILAGIFTAGIGLAQRLFIATTGETSDAAIVLTTLVVATAYAPLRRRLEGIVDRWFKYEHRRFGAYREEVLRVLGVLDPTRAAQRLVSEAVRELEASGGAVVDRDERTLATAGTWPAPSTIRLPIPGGSGHLAALLVGPRTDGRPHDPRVIARLEETAGLAGRAVGLTQPDR